MGGEVAVRGWFVSVREGAVTIRAGELVRVGGVVAIRAGWSYKC